MFLIVPFNQHNERAMPDRRVGRRRQFCAVYGSTSPTVALLVTSQNARPRGQWSIVQRAQRLIPARRRLVRRQFIPLSIVPFRLPPARIVGNFVARRGGSGYGRPMMASIPPYALDDQVGYILRRVTQRHLTIFSAAIPEVTTTQFAVLARLAELGPLSQNRLGREAAMDAATVKGVVDRLVRLDLAATTPDPDDRRRLTVRLTEAGAALVAARIPTALVVSDETLAPLNAEERETLLALLARLI